jgi:hypothetical protein
VIFSFFITFFFKESYLGVFFDGIVFPVIVVTDLTERLTGQKPLLISSLVGE